VRTGVECREGGHQSRPPGYASESHDPALRTITRSGAVAPERSADVVDMRVAALLPIVAVLLGACVFGSDKELEADVMNIAPTDAELFECGWQKNWGSGADKAVYECVFGTRGTLLSVGTELLMNAGQQGFTVWCDFAKKRLEISGVNGKKAIMIDVLASGFTSARTISVVDTTIPAGHVLIDVAVVRRKSPQRVNGPRCIP
jgi:hypothetical protein